jgi:hypothetical protein
MQQLTNPVADFAKQVRDRRTIVQAKLETLKAAVITPLKEAGIASVTITFDGYGDSGAIEETDYTNIAGETCDCPEVELEIAPEQDHLPCLAQSSVALSQALEDLAYLALEQHHPGWEINEGSNGTLTVDVGEASFTLECEVRFIDYEAHSTEV